MTHSLSMQDVLGLDCQPACLPRLVRREFLCWLKLAREADLGIAVKVADEVLMERWAQMMLHVVPSGSDETGCFSPANSSSQAGWLIGGPLGMLISNLLGSSTQKGSKFALAPIKACCIVAEMLSRELMEVMDACLWCFGQGIILCKAVWLDVV